MEKPLVVRIAVLLIFSFCFLHVTFSLFLYSFYTACSTDPGLVSLSFAPKVVSEHQVKEHLSVPRNHLRFTYAHSVRVCHTCEIVYAPRAHHCRECNRCVLRMDHHCPFIDNCVGFWNHKAFILLLFYASVLCTTMIGWTSYVLYEGIEGVFLYVVGISDLLIYILLACNTIVLFIRQMWFVCHNNTNIELWIRHWASLDAKRENKKYRYPYDKGLLHNLKDFMGESVWLWPLPAVVNPLVDPYSYTHIAAELELCESESV